MKNRDLITGLVLGVIVGIHYGSHLTPFMMILYVVGLFLGFPIVSKLLK